MKIVPAWKPVIPVRNMSVQFSILACVLRFMSSSPLQGVLPIKAWKDSLFQILLQIIQFWDYIPILS
jgi:hypothetical protein